MTIRATRLFVKSPGIAACIEGPNKKRLKEPSFPVSDLLFT
ncbi:hypothetical protein GA0061071_107140 [Kosakonia oryzendophytica]|uniref:Uncharacterized protein n=1 Tax=Kosakonia oryzendophytica TaxID=1005665 RepID=A0A1C4CDG8_9ENTR|nr:hypothetical protein DFO53_0804 [Enterobacter sp. AG5470]SCC17187.1 hypothetical protein GA0061071_107140 [Kosakonia oryzendophytica]